MNIHILRGQVIDILQNQPPVKGSEYMEIVWKLDFRVTKEQ